MGVEGYFDDEVSDCGSDCSIEEQDDFGFYKDVDYHDNNDNKHNETTSKQQDIFSLGTKSTTQSLDAGVFRSPSCDEHVGPPRKIVMKRSHDKERSVESYQNDQHDDNMSIDASINSETPVRKRKGVHRKNMPTPVSKPVTATSLNKLAATPDRSISDSIAILKNLNSSLGLVLDMKSRHVSRRIWALVIDFLRDSGARVEGIASFIFEEVRDITQYCKSPVNEFIFIHTAGDLQDGCHTGVIKRG